MFWEKNPYLISEIEQILEKEDVTLELLYLQPSFLQDAKNSSKIHNFLCEKQNLRKIIEYAYSIPSNNVIFENPEGNISTNEWNKALSKLTQEQAMHLSQEILLLEVWAISQTILSSPELLELLIISPFRKEKLERDPTLINRAGKLATQYLTANYPTLPPFIQSHWDTLFPLLLENFNETVIAEITLRVWCSIESPATAPNNPPSFNAAVFADKLIYYLSPYADTKYHVPTSQFLLDLISFAVSSHTPPIHPSTALVLEILKSQRIEQLLSWISMTDEVNFSSSVSAILSVLRDLLLWYPNAFLGEPSELHRSLLIKVTKSIPILKSLVTCEKLIPKPIENTAGSFIPLGKLRLQVAELFVQILKALYFYQELAGSLLPRAQRTTPKNNILLADSGSSSSTIDSINDKEEDLASPTKEEKESYNRLMEALGKEEEKEAKQAPVERTHRKRLSLNLSDTLPILEQLVQEKAPEVVPPTPDFNPIQVELISFHYEATVLLCEQYINEKVLDWMVDMFFQFKWNNFYHSVFVELVQVFLHWRWEEITPSDMFIAQPAEGIKLIEQLFVKTDLIKRLQNAHQENLSRPKSTPSSGNMGYIYQLGSDISHFLSNLPHKPDDPRQAAIPYGIQLIKSIHEQGWDAFLNNTLHPAQKVARGDESSSTLFGEQNVSQVMNQETYSYSYHNDDDDDDDDYGDEEEEYRDQDEDYESDLSKTLGFQNNFMDLDNDDFNDQGQHFYNDRDNEEEEEEDDLGWLNNGQRFLPSGGLVRSFASEDINLLSGKAFQEMVLKEQLVGNYIGSGNEDENEEIQFEMELGSEVPVLADWEKNIDLEVEKLNITIDKQLKITDQDRDISYIETKETVLSQRH